MGSASLARRLLKRPYRAFCKPAWDFLKGRRRFYAALRNYRAGRDLFRHLTEHHGTVYLLPYSSIGDVYILSLFLGEEPFRTEDFVLCVIEQKCLDAAALCGIRNAWCLSKAEAECLKTYLAASGKEGQVLHFSFNHASVARKLCDAYRLGFMECYEALVFRRRLVSMRNPVAAHGHAKSGGASPAGRARACILSPHAKSLQRLPEEFWIRLSAWLREQGFGQVYTNCTEGEEAVPGTVRLCVPLERICAQVEEAGFFFGIRSGLCDLICSTECRKFIFYPRTEGFFASREYYTLRQLPYARNFHEYEVQGGTVPFAAILHDLQEEKCGVMI